ncbi:TetR/AcrR family transcriptional regulator [Streptomyces sp. TR06-5]|uniref:TetR/AcrR family transcriptional regulator n=1 Tax=Streptomyces sp. TR06-5 TaxID=3385976 RepID=UPI0039A036B4
MTSAAGTGRHQSARGTRDAAAGRGLRADALRNRERIAEAAREAFVRFGPKAPLDEIARDAEVGNATLYRHFPDRAALIRHVVTSVTGRIADRAEALTAEPDTFDALRRFAHDAVEERIGALCPLLTDHIDHIDPDDPAVRTARERLEAATEHLMDRARQAGALRGDVGVGDLMVALSRLTRPLPGTSCPDMRRFDHRHLEIFLDGLRAPAGTSLPGRAATFEEVRGTSCDRLRDTVPHRSARSTP